MLEWEKFEKCIGKRPLKDILKGKVPLLQQELVFVPCNPGSTCHWFLLVVMPKKKKVCVLDSMPAMFPYPKPTHSRIVKKMWSILQELDPSLNAKEWDFCTNIHQEIPQQQNAYDCGVYVCMYARALAKMSSIATADTVCKFRKHMILELHEGNLNNPYAFEFNVREYYAVEYLKSYYIGRVLDCPDDNYLQLKFLYSTGARVFDWPRRDDIDKCHQSRVIYGPMKICGCRPFTFPQHIKKNRC